MKNSHGDDSVRESILKDTEEFRESDEPRWQRVRDRLRTEGISSEDAVLADIFQESYGEYGLLYARDGRAFRFDFVYEPDEAGAVPTYEDGVLDDWRQLLPFEQEILGDRLRIAREVINSEVR